jgi:hypothetical protein
LIEHVYTNFNRIFHDRNQAPIRSFIMTPCFMTRVTPCWPCSKRDRSALITELFEYRKRWIERQRSARDMLRTYLEANFEFLMQNFNKFTALFSMGIDLNPAATRNWPWSKEINERCFNFLSDILNSGQQNGEFHRFSIGDITPIIQGAIDGLCLQWISSPELFDLEACEQMLLEIIERFTSVDERSVS